MARFRLHPAVLLGLLAFLAMAPALAGDFVMDDRPAVTESVCVTGPFDPGLVFGTSFWCETEGATVDAWRPLTVAVWWPLWHLGAGDPFPFHLLPVVLHVLCTLGLWSLARELGLVPRAAAVSAAWFAVMPIHVEAVASVVGVADVWAGGLTLAAVLAHRRDSWLAILACAAAAMAKESGFLSIAVLAACSLAAPPPGDRRRAWTRVAIAIFVVVGVLAWRASALGNFDAGRTSGWANPLMGVPLAGRIPGALEIGWRYLALAVTGHPLSADYSYRQIPLGDDVSGLRVGLGAVVLVGTLVLGYRHRRDPAIRFSILWWLGMMAFLCHVVAPLPVVFAERVFYGASVPLCLLAGLGTHRLLDRVRRRGLRRSIQVAAAIYLVVQVGLSARHALLWTNELSLTETTARRSPNSARANLWYASVLGRARQSEAALRHARRAVEILPNWGRAQAIYAAQLDLAGHPKQAAIAFRRAVELQAEDASVADLCIQFMLRYGHVDGARHVYAQHVRARGGRPHPDVTVPPPP